MCAYQEVRNVAFLVNFAYVLYGWSLSTLSNIYDGPFFAKIVTFVKKLHNRSLTGSAIHVCVVFQNLINLFDYKL